MNLGARVDKTDQGGRTALHRVAAANCGQSSDGRTVETCVVILLGAGAKLSLRDRTGKTPFALAKELGLKSVCQVMNAAARVQKYKDNVTCN